MLFEIIMNTMASQGGTKTDDSGWIVLAKTSAVAPVEWWRDSSGVSPVIGVILMVAITVILAAVGGAFFLSLSDDQQENVVTDFESSIDASSGELTIRHRGGDTLNTDDVQVRIENDTDKTIINFEDVVGEDQLTAGANFKTTTTLTGTVRVQIIHEPSNAVLQSTEYKVDGSGGSGTTVLSGSVSVNPDIPNAVVTAYDGNTELASVQTNSSGGYSLDDGDISDISKVSHVSVSVEGASLAPFSNPLYAASKQSVSGSGTYDFTFSNSADATPTVDGSTISVVYGAQEGDATKNPIGNVQMLQSMNDNLAGDYELVSNIDATATSGWNSNNGFDPVGGSATKFTGTFDGNGHVIDGLTISRSGAYIGFFGYIDGATVSNVGLENADITGDNGVGGLVGWNVNGGTVKNSYLTGTVSGDTSTGLDAGGLVGVNQATVENSYSTASVSGDDAVGGLVGSNEGGDVSNSYATGDVSGTDRVGGLLGEHISSASVSTSYAVGAVTGTSNLGGLIGTASSSTTTDSYWDTQSTSQTSSAGGAGLSTPDMQGSSASSNMGGFDFTNTWNTVSSDYPELADT